MWYLYGIIQLADIWLSSTFENFCPFCWIFSIKSPPFKCQWKFNYAWFPEFSRFFVFMTSFLQVKKSLARWKQSKWWIWITIRGFGAGTLANWHRPKSSENIQYIASTPSTSCWNRRHFSRLPPGPCANGAQDQGRSWPTRWSRRTCTCSPSQSMATWTTSRPCAATFSGNL